MTSRVLPALVLLPVLLAGCSDDGGTSTGTRPSSPAASAPAPGVTLEPDALSVLVPAPEEVPAGMVLVTKGSGPRDIKVVASYNGDAGKAAAEAKLRAHGFQSAYVAQYVNPTTGAIVSVVASRFATAEGASADFADDQRATSGTPVTIEQVGEASSATSTKIPGSVEAELLLVRFRKGTTTWSLAYQSAPTADPAVAVGLAKTVLARA